MPGLDSHTSYIVWSTVGLVELMPHLVFVVLQLPVVVTSAVLQQSEGWDFVLHQKRLGAVVPWLVLTLKSDQIVPPHTLRGCHQGKEGACTFILTYSGH